MTNPINIKRTQEPYCKSVSETKETQGSARFFPSAGWIKSIFSKISEVFSGFLSCFLRRPSSLADRVSSTESDGKVAMVVDNQIKKQAEKKPDSLLIRGSIWDGPGQLSQPESLKQQIVAEGATNFKTSEKTISSNGKTKNEEDQEANDCLPLTRATSSECPSVSNMKRKPVGLKNEGGNDCFVNAMRQFVYNTPIAQNIIPKLPVLSQSDKAELEDTKAELENQIKDAQSKLKKIKANLRRAQSNKTELESTKVELENQIKDAQNELEEISTKYLNDYSAIQEDFKNYQEQRIDKSMGGSQKVRKTLMPNARLSTQQDSSEYLMRLFNPIGAKENPFVHQVETSRKVDFASLPEGIQYEHVHPNSKSSFPIDKSNPNIGFLSTKESQGPFTLSMQTGRQDNIGTLQGAWDYYCSPNKYTGDESDFLDLGLKATAPITEDMIKKGQVKKYANGRVEAYVKQEENQLFEKMPERLVFSLNRYTFNFQKRAYKKITRPIDVDGTFKLDHRHVKTKESANFRITSFIVQNGGARFGHYYTYTLKDGKWYKCNDSKITEASPQEVKKDMKCAYVFYAERE